MSVDKELLAIIVCPGCKGDVRLNDSGSGLICDECRLEYPIKDDIPAMLVEEAKSLDA